MKKMLVVIVALFGLSACYPAIQTEQPKIDLRVSDENGQPIDGATFVLAIYSNPRPSFHSTRILIRKTDAEGFVSLSRKLKWRMQVLLPDGVGWHSWAYCVEKQGYQAIVVTESKSKVTGKAVLKTSAVTSRCKFPSEEDGYLSGPVSDDPSSAQPIIPADRGEGRRSR